MGNRFFTWDSFVDGFGKEMTSAEDVFARMVKSGLTDNCLTKMDFTFISDKKTNLLKLGNFIKEHYRYNIGEIVEYDDLFEINGVANEIPITADNLMYWALDMYKRGYEFDAVLDAYGGPFDPKKQDFPDLDGKIVSDYYDEGIRCYDTGDLSGSIFNFSLAIGIDASNPDFYYSRAVVKNELYAWKAALKDYDRAIELAPDFASALINRGGLKDDNGDYLGAIADYQKVLQLEKIDAENVQQAYFNLGNSKLNLKDTQGACENWKKALELGADYALERINDYCQ